MNFNEPGRMRYPVTTHAVCDASLRLSRPSALRRRGRPPVESRFVSLRRRHWEDSPAAFIKRSDEVADRLGDNGRSIHDQEASVHSFVRSSPADRCSVCSVVIRFQQRPPVDTAFANGRQRQTRLKELPSRLNDVQEINAALSWASCS